MFIYCILFIVLCGTNVMAESIAPSLYLNHGGGPYPVLGVKDDLEIAQALKSVKDYVDLRKLKAIIIVTAHWEEDIVSIGSGKNHSMLYDYYNFPPKSYTFQYNAPGDAALASSIQESLKAEGIESKLDDQRGWDHGVFIPMMLIHPEADIPIIPISILASQDADAHYKLGEILYKYRKDGVAIFGSGMSYHNMAEFRKTNKVNNGVIVNEEFDSFLDEACGIADNERRKEKFVNWQTAPGALESHPLHQADHLMPLIVNAGAGGSKPAEKIFSSVYIKKFKLSGYIWKED